MAGTGGPRRAYMATPTPTLSDRLFEIACTLDTTNGSPHVIFLAAEYIDDLETKLLAEQQLVKYLLRSLRQIDRLLSRDPACLATVRQTISLAIQFVKDRHEK